MTAPRGRPCARLEAIVKLYGLFEPNLRELPPANLELSEQSKPAPEANLGSQKQFERRPAATVDRASSSPVDIVFDSIKFRDESGSL